MQKTRNNGIIIPIPKVYKVQTKFFIVIFLICGNFHSHNMAMPQYCAGLLCISKQIDRMNLIIIIEMLWPNPAKIVFQITTDYESLGVGWWSSRPWNKEGGDL